MPFELYVALKYLRAKRRTGFINLISYISVGGVVIGVAALICVLAIMNGFKTVVRSKIIGADAHIRVNQFSNVPFDNFQEVLKITQNTQNITGASPFILEKGLIQHAKNTEGCVIRGTDLETITGISDLPKNIVYGKLTFEMTPPPEGKNGQPLPGIILGESLADKLGAMEVGDKITLFSPNLDEGGGFMAQPKAKQFRVSGIFSTGLYEYDDVFAYISLKDAQTFFQLTDQIHGIDVKVFNLDKVNEAALEINSQLGYPFRAKTWYDNHRNLFAWMEIEEMGMFAILSLIILVAAFNIISSLTMVVLEKTREIGILKSMGAFSNQIRNIFVLQGLIIGTSGTFVGSVLGFVLCWLQKTYELISLPGDVYIIYAVPVEMEISHFVFVGITSVLLCYLASIYPASKAAGLIPVEAINYN
ncbi:ABC transporter permease [bacterium]|nr:ABC transporter permease [bacterium]